MTDPKELLKVLLQGRNSIPDMEDLTDCILQEFGGFKKFAQELHIQYTACKKTPMAASRMLESVMRLITAVNANRKASALDNMSTEEIEAVIVNLLKETDAKKEGAAKLP